MPSHPGPTLWGERTFREPWTGDCQDRRTVGTPGPRTDKPHVPCVGYESYKTWGPSGATKLGGTPVLGAERTRRRRNRRKKGRRGTQEFGGTSTVKGCSVGGATGQERSGSWGARGRSAEDGRPGGPPRHVVGNRCERGPVQPRYPLPYSSTLPSADPDLRLPLPDTKLRCGTPTTTFGDRFGLEGETWTEKEKTADPV